MKNNNDQLKKEISKVINELITEGLFDKLKAKASGAAGQIGQYGKNIAAFAKGDKDAIADPNLVKGINTLRSRITGLNKSLQSTSQDLLDLFPEPSKLPGDLQKIVGDYSKQMQDILNYHTKLLKTLNTGQAGADAAKPAAKKAAPAAKSAAKSTTKPAAKKSAPAAKPAQPAKQPNRNPATGRFTKKGEPARDPKTGKFVKKTLEELLRTL
jgi:hypothetical protein